MKKSIVPLILLLLAAIIWGFAFVAQVQGMDYIGPFTLIGIRFVIGALTLVPVALAFEKGRPDKLTRKRTLTASVAAGVVLFCASSFQQMGIKYTGSAGVAGFITGLYTVLIPIACYVLFKQRTSFTVAVGAVCALFGLFLLCYRKGEGLYFGYGELLLLVGALFWTAHVMVVDRMGKSIRPIRFSMGQFAVCGVIGLVFMLLLEEPTVSAIISAKWSILYCGILSSGVAFTLQVVAQKRAEPTIAAIIMSSESMFSAVGGVLFGIDKISAIGYVGCALMFAGIVLSQLDIRIKKRSVEKRD